MTQGLGVWTAGQGEIGAMCTDPAVNVGKRAMYFLCKNLRRYLRSMV